MESTCPHAPKLPLVFASATAVLFGLFQQYSVVPAVAALPEFAWELTLAIYLIVKGFNPSADKWFADSPC